MKLFERLWELKNNLPGTIIHAVLKRDVEAVEYDGHPLEDKTPRLRTIPKGTKVRIWMVSRFGDVGITDNLNGYGYCARVGSYGHEEKTQVRNPGDLEEYLAEVIINPKQPQ